jgi:hypothetical protein
MKENVAAMTAEMMNRMATRKPFSRANCKPLI